MKEIPLEELFGDSLTEEQIKALDLDEPKVKKTTTTLPPNFKIRDLGDIKTLEEFSAINYCRGIRLYRGHASTTFNLDSSLTRLFKKKKCSPKDVVEAEKTAFNLFSDAMSKYWPKWFEHKLDKFDKDLFIMSIGRHLGLPCRLIDVTSSLETAVWFAVMDPRNYNEDGEVILIVLDKNKVNGNNISPFNVNGVAFAHEPFKTDSLDDLPLGEQRRFIQCGSFLYVENSFLNNEEDAIKKNAFKVQHFQIPHDAKLELATALYRDVYSGFAFQSTINSIKNIITLNA